MINKYDYTKNTFKSTESIQGEKHYFMYVNNSYIEVPHDVYKVCKASLQKDIRDQKKSIVNNIRFNDDLNYRDASYRHCPINTELDEVKYLIETLPSKYRNIAKYILLEEMSVTTVSKLLKITPSTVYRRKNKVIEILRENILKN